MNKPKLPSPKRTFGEWQICPKCNGNKFIIEYNPAITAWATNTVCDICSGTGLVARPIIKT